MKANNSDTEIQWRRFSNLERLYSIPRSTAYLWILDALIRSRLVRRKGERGAGMRLIDMASVRQFIEGSPRRRSKRVSSRMRALAYESHDKNASGG